MLRRASAVKDWGRATAAFFALADHDPDAFHDPALVVAARDLAAVAGLAGGDEADRIFDVLAKRLGSAGPDILYEIVRTRGGAKSATRAHELLRSEEVLARATAELRITVALRDAACPDKTALLDRAVAEGDGRTLLVMQTVGAACLGRNQALYDAQRALRNRLQGLPPPP
jgi:serine/threonine-protein kinase